MKVLFDHQLFSWQKYGGASKYFAELMANLPREVWECTAVFSNNAYLEELNLFPYHHFMPKHLFKGQGKLMHIMNIPYSSYRLWKKDYDVYHQMHFDPYGLKFIGDKPLVTTFHDINFSTYNPKPHEVKRQKVSLSRADKVIAVSQNTKKDVIESFNLPEEKVEVVYHGIDLKPIPDSSALYNFPYILFVGTRRNHKNFDRLLLAYQKYVKTFPEVKLVCTWKGFAPDELERINQLGLADQIIHHSATEEEMRILYRDALFYIFPSIYEGFGMPILEAMSLKCPVVLANASCFPEIAQDAGVYFDPLDIDSMTEAMTQITGDEDLRNKMIDLGGKRVREFSWKKCADEHLKVYKSLI